MKFDFKKINKTIIVDALAIMALAYVICARPLFWSPEVKDENDDIKHYEQEGLILGLDVSHYQGIIDWSEVESSGVDFVVLKATEGVKFIDPMFNKHRDSLKETSMLTGAYHFFHPGIEPIKQAEYFLKHVDIRSGSIPPVLDVETTGGLGSEELSIKVTAWLEHVHARSGCRPLVYTNHHFWKKHLKGRVDNFHYWLADYAEIEPDELFPKSWLFYQHSQKGVVPGIKVRTDLDFFKGDKHDLEKITCSKGLLADGMDSE